MNRTQTRCEYIHVRSDAASLPHTVCLSAHVDGTGNNTFDLVFGIYI